MQLPEAASPEQAQQMAQQYMKAGFDGIKLFTGAFMGAKPTINMDTAIVKAAVEVAHAQGKPVFTHPQNRTGTDNALAGGVDILAHTIPTEVHSRRTGANEAAAHRIDSDIDALDDCG
jgi:tagatose-1,6-bisphosphate aldolase non-catalytic subunit AgaZ/GatZ